MPSFDQTPDAPQSFGYKISWFAIRTSDPAAVLDALEFGEATQANWTSGLAAAYPEGASRRGDAWVFISPPVDGWVLAVSFWWPYPVSIEAQRDIGKKFDLLFSRLMKRFDDVQFFGSYRVVGFVAWARALKGAPVRLFAFADADVLANFGEQTSEEAKLGFANLSGLSPSEAGEEIFRIAAEQDPDEDEIAASGVSRDETVARVRQNSRSPFPDEEEVVELAALWSIDPMRLSDQDHPPGLGLAVRMPKHLTQ